MMPAGDETRRALAPVVKLISRSPQTSRFLRPATKKHLIRFNRVEQPVLCTSRKSLRGAGGRTSVIEPAISLEHCQQLRGDKASFGEQVASTLPSPPRLFGQSGIEQHQSLSVHRPVL